MNTREEKQYEMARDAQIESDIRSDEDAFWQHHEKHLEEIAKALKPMMEAVNRYGYWDTINEADVIRECKEFM